jgi:hypothetical protein
MWYMMYARVYIYQTIPCKTLKTNADRASHVFDAQPARPPASKGLIAELPDLSGLKSLARAYSDFFGLIFPFLLQVFKASHAFVCTSGHPV